MNIGDNYQSMTSFMMGLKLDELEHLLVKHDLNQKPKFRICFRYTNPPKYRPGKPYLVPMNASANRFRNEFYGKNGIRFNSNCV